MPIPKNRGKSAAILNGGGGGGGVITIQQNNTNSSQQQQQQSLLKIESVLPTLSRNPNKSMYRSYSTLSTGYFKKTLGVVGGISNTGVAVGGGGGGGGSGVNGAGGGGGGVSNGIITTITSTNLTTAVADLNRKLQNSDNSQNGFWRIQRTIKEKEKLPDRINLDRRGLTAMPIIDDEPHLRLLSLQHNLINSFSVPDCNSTKQKIDEKNSTTQQPLQITSQQQQQQSPPTIEQSPPPPPQPQLPPQISSNGINIKNKHQVQQKLPKSQQLLLQRAASTRNLLINVTTTTTTTTTTATFISNGTSNNSNNTKLQSSNINGLSPSSAPTVAPVNGAQQQQQQQQSSSIINNNNNNSTGLTTMKNSFIQKSVLLHAKERYVFKKSTSFINNYSQHLAATKMQHLARLLESNNKGSQDLIVPPTETTVGSEVATTTSTTNNTDRKQTPPLQQQQQQQPIPPIVTVSSSSIIPVVNGKIIEPPPILCIKNQPYPNVANNLQNLVFLDLYDNQIEKIAPLDGLKSLTVLLLGKNRITDISGIISVKQTIRVLDLHGNKITNITSKISQLQELKSLNLAGNSLKQIHADDFKNLLNLRELNLKRNKIKKIVGFDDLRSLERLWLCHNDLQKVEDMSAIAKAINLKEVTIENNPVSLGGDCVSFLVSYLPCLVMLSQMQVTEQVRRAAMAWRKSKETTDAQYSHLTNDVCQSIRREEIISNARTNWELLRSQQHVHQLRTSAAASYIQKTIKNSTVQQLQIPIGGNGIDMVNGDDTYISGGGGGGSDLLPNYERGDKTMKKSPTTAERKVINKQKNISNRSTRIQQKTTGARHQNRRSSSQDNLSIAENGNASGGGSGANNSNLSPNIIKTQEDFFRLPPILAPFVIDEKSTILDVLPTSSSPQPSNALAILSQQQHQQQQSSNSSPDGSSLGPNVDSSSSCLSSDNEDNGKLQSMKISTTPEDNMINKIIGDVQFEIANDKPSEKDIHQTITNPDMIIPPILLPLDTIVEQSIIASEIALQQKSPTPATGTNTPVNNAEEDYQSDKTSNLSTNSIKSTSDSTTSTTSAITDDQQQQQLQQISSTTSISKPGSSASSSSQKCKSATPKNKLNSQLVRAHTAKSININAQANGPNNHHNPSNGQTLQQQQQQQPHHPPHRQQQQQHTKSSTQSSNHQQHHHHHHHNHHHQNDREREQGGDYLIEICGRYLNVYGAGAIKFIDRQWNQQKANDVHTFKFSYVNFTSIATILSKIKLRFPNAENFVFRETNINFIGQLNALAEVQGISSLVIDPEGNLICTKSNWRQYAVFRLSHWGIKSINGIDVTEDEIQDAQKTYSGLSDLVLWSLPEALLEPLLTRLRLDETCTASKLSAKQWLMQADPSLKQVVGKEALQCKKLTGGGAIGGGGGGGGASSGNNGTNSNTAAGGPSDEELALRQRGKAYFTFMMENTCNAVLKLQKLETLWPNLLIEMIRNTLLDYSQIDVYVKHLMVDLMKSPQPPT